MTSQSHAERLISAAHPALAAELDKILGELRSRMQSEADLQVQSALAEKEAEHQAELERVRQTLTAEAEARFQAELAEERRKAAEAESAAEKRNKQQESLEHELERWRTLAEYLTKLSEASSQLEILRRFLMSGSRFASSVAVYLEKQDGLSLWKTEGEHVMFPQRVAGESIDPDWFYSPVVVRGKTVAAVCAAGPTDQEALAVMVAALKRAVENFGLRLRFMAGEARQADPVPAESASVPGAPAEAAPSAEAASVGAPAIEMPAEPEIDENDPRRVARTLVAEIKLSHEKEVLEGRVNGDLYRRLRAPIDEGRRVYASRVHAEPGTDYFHEEVVKILADNVVSRLGAEYPGPR